MAINPLQNPIDYAGMIPQVNIGQQIDEFAQIIQARRQEEQARQANEQFSSDLQGAMKDGSQIAWANMIAKYPKMREAFGDVRKAYGEEKLKNEFNQGLQISTALKNKNPDVAKQILADTIAAKSNSNEDPGIYKQIFDLVDSGDFESAQSAVNMSLALADPDNFQKAVKGLTEAEKMPSEISSSKSAATKAAVEAKYAEKQQRAALDKVAADIGLTNAQTSNVIKNTEKLGFETSKAALELEKFKQTGGIDPSKKFEQEEKIRKEWQTRSQLLRDSGVILDKIKASAASRSGAGDVALVTSIQKMLDPPSVVRDTEFARSASTEGFLKELENRAQRLKTGELLDDKMRQKYVVLAQQYYDAALKKGIDDRKSLSKVVNNYGLNPDNVFGEDQLLQEPKATPTPQPAEPIPAGNDKLGKGKPIGGGKFSGFEIER